MMDDDGEGEGKAQDKEAPKKAAPQGWGSPTAKPNEDSLREAKAPEEEEDEDDKVGKVGRRRNLRDMKDDETEMVMMIPDLDEDETEDITLQVAAAPRNLARRLPSLEQVIS